MTLLEHPIVHASVRLGLAFLLGIPLGWERERHYSVGLRTYPLVSACVCGFFLIAQTVGGHSEQANVFYGVLSGIAFVAYGTIAKPAERPSGMSTAVSLWVSGAIGAGVSYGASLISAVLSLTTALTLWAPLLLVRWRRMP